MVDSAAFERLERFVSAELAGRRHPGSSISVVEGDKVAWVKGFGYADLRNNVPAAPETVYRCASVTKPVVTVGFLQLMERGKFSLDDTVNDHLDVKVRVVQGEEPIIRDLLTHYSGMPTRVPPLYLLGEEALRMRDYVGDAARMVQPRRRAWAYCNTAFTIVGYLMELFTGSSYDVYLREHVLKPLGMSSSDFDLTPMLHGRVAQGYKRDGGPEKPLIPVAPYVLGTRPQDPAGSLYSTVIDLANFVIMNLNGGVFRGRRLLKEETVEEMQRLQAPTGVSRSGMGLTWFRTIHDGHVMLYHTGGLPDYTNHVSFYPELGLGVCWLSNLQDGSGWRPPAPTALRILSGESPSFESQRIQSVPENWDRIVGVYGDETRQSTLRYVNGFLVLDDRLILERVDDARFIVHGPGSDGEEFTVEYGGDGMVKQFDLGTGFHPRYVPEDVRLDVGAELTGEWYGEYFDSFGFHTLGLRIEGEGKAMAMDQRGEWVDLEGVRALLGRVEGGCRFRIPAEYARWGVDDWAHVSLQLAAVDGRLRGFIRTPAANIPVTLEKGRANNI